jgi:hypothetical protein
MIFPLVLLATVLALPAGAEPIKTWPFKVYLDDTEIGHHTFELRRHDMGQEMRTHARFEVKLLRLALYSYRHDNVEHWRDDCLQALEATTDENGQRVTVRARAHGGLLRVQVDERATELSEPCAMSFAYWNPVILRATRLLHPQTGALVDVRITPADTEPVPVGEQTVPGRRYILRGRDLRIDLFYSEQGEWLALYAPIKGGRTLRYRLERLPRCVSRGEACT